MTILEHLEKRDAAPRFGKRISYLSNCLKIDPRHIEACVSQCEVRLNRGVEAMVVYGEPQSGKTEFMIALSCKLMDLGYETIVVLVNDNIELEKQNHERFASCKQFEHEPVRSVNIDPHINEDIRKGRERVIFCRKNAGRLRELIHNIRFMEKLAIIDDEADYATPDNNVNDEAESSAINRLVSKLIHSKKGTYIGVTATPGRLDLNDTFQIEPENWVFLDPPAEYVGREVFFPRTVGEDKAKFHLVQISEMESIASCRKKAVMRFLIRAAFLNRKNIKNECGKITGYTMLMHTSGRINEHLKEKQELGNLLSKLDRSGPRGDLEKQYGRIRDMVPEALPGENADPLELAKIIYDNIGRRRICVINSSDDRDDVEKASNPSSMFTIAIGGNLISRGLTFNNLLTYFFTRGVQGAMIQGTYIQRARMFGMRKDYLRHIEITVPDALYSQWNRCFTDHEMSIGILRNSRDYLHVYSDGTRPAPDRSIRKNKVENLQGEIPAGDIFHLTDAARDIIQNADLDALERIEMLLERGLLGDNGFRGGIYEYLKKISRGDRTKIAMVLLSNGKIHDISQYKDHDGVKIDRKDGGDIISATIRGRRKHFSDFNHFIMPTRYKDKARFIYAGNENKKIMLKKAGN